MNPNYWQMPEDSTELKKGMSYDTELVRGSDSRSGYTPER